MAQEFDKLTVTISSPSLGTRTLENLKNVLILANHEEDSQDRTGVYKALVGAVNKRDRIEMMAALLTNKDRTAAQFREAVAIALMVHNLEIGIFSGTEVKEDSCIPMDDHAGGYQ